MILYNIPFLIPRLDKKLSKLLHDGLFMCFLNLLATTHKTFPVYEENLPLPEDET